MIKLSIIIPVYNAEKYLKECLDSIVKEIDKTVEVIIVDDGSTDNSKHIYQEYASKNVKAYKILNHGVSYARNYGIGASMGEYICFVDADDFMNAGWMKEVKNILKNNNDDVIFIGSSFKEKSISKDKILDYTFKVDNTYRYFSTPWSKLFKRDFIIDNGIKFDEGVIVGEDMLFITKCIKKTSKISFIESSIYTYRINNLSVSNSFNDKIFASDQKFHALLKDILTDTEKYKKYDEYSIENAIIKFIKKISTLKSKDAKKYLYIFKEEPYARFINSNNKYNSRFNEYIIKSIKKEKYKRIIVILKSGRFVKRIIKRNKYKEIKLKI